MIELKERFDGLYVITEKAPGAGKVVYKFSGPFQEMADVTNRKNRNGRRYESSLWRRALTSEDVLERLKAKRMLGELDHPLDEGQIRRTSHIVTELTPDYDKGIVYGKLELLNHDQGDAALIRALVEQGVELCVSSRGYGDYLKDGCTIDPESYNLRTWDIVLDPSVPIAKLNQVAESVNKHMAPESRASKFREDGNQEKKTVVPGADLKGEENNNPKSKESAMENEKLMTELSDVKVNLAKSESTVSNLKEKLDDKNTVIARLEQANVTLNTKVEGLAKQADEAAEVLRNLTAENKTLRAAKTAAESKVADYSKVEEEAVETINGLIKKIAAMEKLHAEAQKVIESLTKKLKEVAPETDDTEKGADGKDKEKGEEAGDENGDEENPETSVEEPDADETDENKDGDETGTEEDPKTEGRKKAKKKAKKEGSEPSEDAIAEEKSNKTMDLLAEALGVKASK